MYFIFLGRTAPSLLEACCLCMPRLVYGAPKRYKNAAVQRKYPGARGVFLFKVPAQRMYVVRAKEKPVLLSYPILSYSAEGCVVRRFLFGPRGGGRGRDRMKGACNQSTLQYIHFAARKRDAKKLQLSGTGHNFAGCRLN